MDPARHSGSACSPSNPVRPRRFSIFESWLSKNVPLTSGSLSITEFSAESFRPVVFEAPDEGLEEFLGTAVAQPRDDEKPCPEAEEDTEDEG